MSDLISREAILKHIEKIRQHLQMMDDTYRISIVMEGVYICESVVRNQPSAQSEIIRCKDCKYWMPYDWMFNEIWRSQNINDYSDDEIGCEYYDMTMKANDFCSRAERRGKR
jgi:hypothetical protein